MQEDTPPYRLLDQPADWWQTPLQDAGLVRVEAVSRLPRHLLMGRRLLERPVTPSQLRYHARVSLSELRRFIQASLFVGVARWDLQARKR